MPEEILKEIRILSSLKDYAGIRDLLRANVFENAIEYWYYLAHANRKIGNRDEAEKCCEKVLQISPTNRQAKFELGLIYQNDGDYKRAIDFLEQAASPEDGEVDFEEQVDILNSLALTYKKKKDYTKALEIYKMTADFLFNVAKKKALKSWREENPGDEPTEELIYPVTEKLLRSNKQFCTLLNNQGVLYAEIGDRDSAREAFRDAIKFTPDFVEYSEPHIGLRELES